jgi:hypothetical protein
MIRKSAAESHKNPVFPRKDSTYFYFENGAQRPNIKKGTRNYYSLPGI